MSTIHTFPIQASDAEKTPPISPCSTRWYRRSRTWLALSLATVLWIVFIGPWYSGWIKWWPSPNVEAESAHAIITAAEPSPNRIASGPLRAGWATRELTPVARGVPLAGYIERVRTANTGIADTITARAVVLDNGERRIAIVSADLLLINRKLADLVCDKLVGRDQGWRREDLFFGATHTHSAPGGYGNTWVEALGLGWPRPDVADQIASRLAEAVVNAHASMAPTEMTTTAVNVDARLIRNRTRKTDSTNRWLDLLVFRKLGTEQQLATVIVFSAHATCRPSSDLQVSGDYPGVLMREVEETTGGMCVFLAGGVGSMAPPDKDVCARADLAEFLGRELSRSAILAVRSAKGFRRAVPLATIGCFISLPTTEVKVGANWRLSPVLASQFLPEKAWIHGLRIGDRVLMGAPADYSGVLAERLRGVATGTTTVVTSFNGDYIGYLLPDDYYDLPKYEPRQMCFYGGHAGTLFQQSLTKMARHLSR